MCVEDVVISRGTYLKSTTVPSGGAVDLDANLDRIALSMTVNAVTNTRAMISIGKNTAGNSIGVIVSSSIGGTGADKIGESNMIMDYRRYPGMVHDAMSVHCVGAQGIIHEHIMTPDLARAVRRQEDKLLHGG